MKAKEVLEILNITRPTLTSYVKKGLIKVTQSSQNGKYDYDEDSVYALQKNCVMSKDQSRKIEELNDKINKLSNMLKNCVIVFEYLQQIRLLTPQAVEAKDRIKKELEQNF